MFWFVFFHEKVDYSYVEEIAKSHKFKSVVKNK